MAVATSQLPELERGEGAPEADDENAKRRKAKRSKKTKRRKSKAKAREAAPFHLRVREADVRRAGKAFEVVLIREGPGNAVDANWYSAEALRKAVSDRLFEGARCYADHPTAAEERERPERSVRTLIGSFEGARLVQEGGRAAVRARFKPVTGPGYEWVHSLIESALDSPSDKPLVGLSIDGFGHAQGEKEVDGRRYSVVREIARLGSVDLVTTAGAGGRFVRQLTESIAGAKAAVTDPPTVGPRKLQKTVAEALRRLERGLGVEDDREVHEAFVRLHEAASAHLKLSEPEADTEKLADAEKQLKRERKRRRVAEARADELDHVLLAGRLLREADVSPRTAEIWLEDLAVQRDEAAMRAVLERRTAERREQLIEVRESLGLNHVEGVPAREQAGPAVNGNGGGDLLSRMGIDPDELRSAA